MAPTYLYLKIKPRSGTYYILIERRKDSLSLLNTPPLHCHTRQNRQRSQCNRDIQRLNHRLIISRKHSTESSRPYLLPRIHQTSVVKDAPVSPRRIPFYFDGQSALKQ